MHEYSRRKVVTESSFNWRIYFREAAKTLELGVGRCTLIKILSPCLVDWGFFLSGDAVTRCSL